MTVNCFNIKRGDGKTKRAIELCIHGVREGKNVLFLVRNMSEVARVIELFIKCEFIDYTKIDIYPYTGNYMERLYGKKYNLVVIDECFNMKLDEQARFLEEMSFRNPNCGIVGFGSEVQRKTFRDFAIDTIDVWEPFEESKEIIKKG